MPVRNIRGRARKVHSCKGTRWPVRRSPLGRLLGEDAFPAGRPPLFTFRTLQPAWAAACAWQVCPAEDPLSLQVRQHFWKGSAYLSPIKLCLPDSSLEPLRTRALPVPDFTILFPAATEGTAAPILERWKNKLRSSFALGERESSWIFLLTQGKVNIHPLSASNSVPGFLACSLLLWSRDLGGLERYILCRQRPNMALIPASLGNLRTCKHGLVVLVG